MQHTYPAVKFDPLECMLSEQPLYYKLSSFLFFFTCFLLAIFLLPFICCLLLPSILKRLKVVDGNVCCIRVEWTLTEGPVLVIQPFKLGEGIVKFLSKLVNTYAPLVLVSWEVDSLRLHILRTLLRGGRVSGRLINSRLLWRRTNMGEWDESWFNRRVIFLRRWAAVFSQVALNEPAALRYLYPWRWWGSLVDELIFHLEVICQGAEIRIEDHEAGNSFGFAIRHTSLKQGSMLSSSLGAVPQIVSWAGLVLYCDPQADLQEEEPGSANSLHSSTKVACPLRGVKTSSHFHHPLLEFDNGSLIFEFPYIWKTILNRSSFMPNGRAKRMRIWEATFHNTVLHLDPNQAQTFLRICIGAFCPGMYNTWKQKVIKKCESKLQHLSKTEQAEYQKAVLRNNSVVLERMELNMTYGDMIALRMLATGWQPGNHQKDCRNRRQQLKSSLLESDAAEVLLFDTQLLNGLDPTIMSRYAAECLSREVMCANCVAWESTTILREIMVEPIQVGGFKVCLRGRSTTAVNETTTIPGSKSNVNAVLSIETLHASTRLLIGRTAKSQRYYSVSATGEIGEPSIPWIGGSLELIHPVLIDETDQVVEGTGISCTSLEESVIGGCLLDHHSPISSSGQQQPDLPFCATTASAAGPKKVPEEATTTATIRFQLGLYSNKRLTIQGSLVGITIAVLPLSWLRITRVVQSCLTRCWGDGGARAATTMNRSIEDDAVRSGGGGVLRSRVDEEVSEGMIAAAFNDHQLDAKANLKGIHSSSSHEIENHLEGASVTMCEGKRDHNSSTGETDTTSVEVEIENRGGEGIDHSGSIDSSPILLPMWKYLLFGNWTPNVKLSWDTARLLMLQYPGSHPLVCNIIALESSGKINTISHQESESGDMSINRLSIYPCVLQRVGNKVEDNGIDDTNRSPPSSELYDDNGHRSCEQSSHPHHLVPTWRELGLLVIQERSLLYLENVTDCNDDSAAAPRQQQQQQQQPALDMKEEDVTSNVLNLAYSGVLCDEEEVLDRDGHKNCRAAAAPKSNNSTLVCALNSNRIGDERDGVAKHADMGSGVVTADIESGGEGLLVAVLDRRNCKAVHYATLSLGRVGERGENIMGGVSSPTQSRFRQCTSEDRIDQAVLPLSEANLRSWAAECTQDPSDYHHHSERSCMVTIGLFNEQGRAISYTNPSLLINLEDCTERFGDWHRLNMNDDGELAKQVDKEGELGPYINSPRICFSWKPATLLVRVLQCRHLTSRRRLEPLITVKLGGVTEKTCQFGECVALGIRAQARLPSCRTTVLTITLAHRGTVADEMIGTAEVEVPPDSDLSTSLIQQPDINSSIPSRRDEDDVLGHHEFHLNPASFSQQGEKYWRSIKSAGGDIAGEILVSVAWGERMQQQHHNREDSGQSLPPPEVSTTSPVYDEEDDEDIKEHQTGDDKLLQVGTTPATAAATMSIKNAPDQSTSNGRQQRVVTRHVSLTCVNVSVHLSPLDTVVIMGVAKSISAMLHEFHGSRTESRVGGVGRDGKKLSSGTLGFKQRKQVTKVGGSLQDSLALEILAKHEAFEEYVIPTKGAARYMDLRGVVTLMKEHERRLGLTESEILAELSAFVEMILQQGRGGGGDPSSGGSDGNDNASIATSTGPAPDANFSTPLNSNKTVAEGFLCPSCRCRLRDARGLMAHFEILHQEEHAASVGSIVSLSPMSYKVTVENFILALEHYQDEPHAGPVSARCGEFASREVVDEIISPGYSLPELLAHDNHNPRFPAFWDVYERETGGTRDSIGGQDIRTLQIRMVRCFRSYAFAAEAWRFVVAPELFRLPTALRIHSASEKLYRMMPAPVVCGTSYYVDKRIYKVLSLPPHLSRRGIHITGIATHRKDRSVSGVRAFLTFHISRPAVVMVCYDSRLRHPPVWLLYFRKTHHKVETTEGIFEVWEKRYPVGIIRLGCNEGTRKGCANYFVLLAPDLISGPPDPVRLSQIANESWTPHWLLTEQSPAGGRESRQHAIESLVERQRSKSWQERLKTLGRFDEWGSSSSPLSSSSFIMDHLDDRTITSDHIRGSVTPVVLNSYNNVRCEIGSVSLEFIIGKRRRGRRTLGCDAKPNSSSPRRKSIRPQLVLRLDGISSAFSFVHTRQGDVLGKRDSLSFVLRCGLEGTYLNGISRVSEHFLEPLNGDIHVENVVGSAVTSVSMTTRNHLVLNITSALVDTIKDAARLIAVRWGDTYHIEALRMRRWGTMMARRPVTGGVAGNGRVIDRAMTYNFKLRNRVGCDVSILGVVSWEHGVAEDDKASSKQKHWKVKSNDSNAGAPSPPEKSTAETTSPAPQNAREEGKGGAIKEEEEVHSLPAVRQGFLCPECRASLNDPDDLLRHLQDVHYSNDPSMSFDAVVQVPPGKERWCSLAPNYHYSTRMQQTPPKVYSSSSLIADSTSVVTIDIEGFQPIVNVGVGIIGRTVYPFIPIGDSTLPGNEYQQSGPLLGLALVVIVAEDAKAAHMVVELMSNIQVANHSTFDVVVGLDCSSSNNACSMSSPTSRDQSILLHPQETCPLPLQIVTSGKLSVYDGGGGSSVSSANMYPSIQLTSALLDPIVPDALRYTHSMEVNSISLQAIATMPVPPPSEALVVLPSSSADNEAKGVALGGERDELTGGCGGINTGDMTGRTEWKLIVHSPLVFVNTLPCDVEIELAQSCLGSGVVATTEHQCSGTDGDHAVASSSIRGDHVPRRFEGAKDLFFLPDIVKATNGQASASVESEASRRKVKVAAANSFASLHGDKFQGSSTVTINEEDLPEMLKPVWTGVVEVGKKVKVGPLARNELVFFRVRLSAGSGGGQGLGHSWSDPEVLYPAERDSREAFNSEPPHCITWKKAAVDYDRIHKSEYEEMNNREGRKGANNIAKDDHKDEELFMTGTQWGGSKCLRMPRVVLDRAWGRTTSRNLILYCEYWVINKTGLALWYRSLSSATSLSSSSSSFSSPKNKASASPLGHHGLERETPSRRETKVSAKEDCRTVLMGEAEYSNDDSTAAFFGLKNHDYGRMPTLMGCPQRKLQVMPYGTASDIGLCPLVVCDVMVMGGGGGTKQSALPPKWYQSSLQEGKHIYTDHKVTLRDPIPDCLAGGMQLVGPRQFQDPETESAIIFWTTVDAFVYVCAKSSDTADRKSHSSSNSLLQWLAYGGWRYIPGISISRSDGVKLTCYRRFCCGTTLVKLGGWGKMNEATIIVVSAVTARQGMREEADIRGVTVSRDVREMVMCRERYKLLPLFGAGDQPYVDLGNTIVSLPDELEMRKPLLCLRTANGDRRCSGTTLVRVLVMHRVCALVCVDSRAPCPPPWIGNGGYTKVENVLIPAVLEKGHPYNYELYYKLVNPGLLWFGGNAPGAKCMYFVLFLPAERWLLDIGSSSQRCMNQPLSEVDEPQSTLPHLPTTSLKYSSSRSLLHHSTCIDGSSYWDVSSCGPLEHPNLILDKGAGPKWSKRFNADAASTYGQLEGASVALGVTISRLPGVFHRSTVITLYPRYIVRNELSIPVSLSPPLELPPGVSGVLYNFSSENESAISQQGSTSSIRSKVSKVTSGSPTKTGRRILIQGGNEGGISVDNMGEEFLWVTDAIGRCYLVCAMLTLVKATVFITLSDKSAHPPYRIENRTSTTTLMYRQQGREGGAWRVLPPLRWHSFLWDDPMGTRELCVMPLTEGMEREKIPTTGCAKYSLDHIGQVEGFACQLHAEVRAHGRTRVLSLSDVLPLEPESAQEHADGLTQFRRFYNCLEVHVTFAGIETNLIRCYRPPFFLQELHCLHVDDIRLVKHAGTGITEISIFHIQADDMRSRATFATVLQPADSGYNSHLSFAKFPLRPFFRMSFEREVGLLGGVRHFKVIDTTIGDMIIRMDMDYLLLLASFITEFLPQFNDEAVLGKFSRKTARGMLKEFIVVPRASDSSLIYAEVFRHGQVVLHTEFMAGPKTLNLWERLIDDPSSSNGLAMLGGGFVSIVGALGGRLSRVRPTFVFKEVIVTHYFGTTQQLYSHIMESLRQEGMAQSYKLVGSMDLLGDPAGFLDNLGTGVSLFISNSDGVGTKLLIKGVIGGAFGSASKIAGSLEGVVRGLGGLYTLVDYATPVQNLEHGVGLAGDVFIDTLKQGWEGLVDRPMEAAAEEGMAGFLGGIAKGIVGVVAAPVAGALGAVSRVTSGVDAQTRFHGDVAERAMNRRRTPRGAIISTQGKLPIVSEAMLNAGIPEGYRKEPKN